jgi:hypothetical protein
VALRLCGTRDDDRLPSTPWWPPTGTTTFDAARALDLRTVRTPLVAASMWIRALPACLFGKATPPRLHLVIGEGLGLPGWLLLGE